MLPPSLYNIPISQMFNESQLNTNQIKTTFDQLQKKWLLDLSENFKDKFENLDDLYKKGDFVASQVISESLDQAMLILATHKIYSIGEDQFFHSNVSRYFTWDEDFSVITKQLEDIIENSEELDQYRTQRRKNRDRYIGYGAHGEGQAMFKNFASNVGHGLFNVMAKGITEINNHIQKQEIFDNPKTKKQFLLSIQNIISATYCGTVDFLSSIDGVEIHQYGDDDIHKSKALLDSINKGRVPESETLPILLEAMLSYPYHREVFIALFKRYGHDNFKLDELMEYFGHNNLQPERLALFRNKMQGMSFTTVEQCSSNLPLLKEYADKLGFSDFENETKNLLSLAINHDFNKKFSTTDLSSVETCRINLPMLQVYANEIGYQGFEQQADKILNTVVTKAFNEKVSKYKIKTLQDAENTFPIIEEYAQQIGYPDFETWKCKILSKLPKPKVIQDGNASQSKKIKPLILMAGSIIALSIFAISYFYTTTSNKNIPDDLATTNHTNDNASDMTTAVENINSGETNSQLNDVDEQITITNNTISTDTIEDFNSTTQETTHLRDTEMHTVQFPIGESCDTLIQEHYRYSLILGANQTLTVSTFAQDVIVIDPNGNEITPDGQDYGQWLTTVPGPYTITIIPSEHTQGENTIEFCAY